MLDLRQGDRLPIVAAVQVLLNAYRLISKNIEVDGVFGRDTRDATKVLQQQNDLKVTGRIDLQTWKALARGNQLALYDSVDIFDPNMKLNVETLQRMGAKPSVVGGQCNGVASLYGLLASEVQLGKLALLRFQGHGNKGKQVVSYGTGHHLLFDAIRGEAVPDVHVSPSRLTVPPAEIAATRLEIHYSSISVDSLADPKVASELARIRPFFHPLGSTEFHGCHVGGGAEGSSMLQRVADLLQVPAVGAIRGQHMDAPFAYDGPIKMRFPGGVPMRVWAERLPAIRAYG